MTRKKFVKQLMAMGYQRNTANILAMCARVGGSTYEQWLQREKAHIAHQRAMLGIQVALVDCFTPVVRAASQALDRLCEAFVSVKREFPDTSTLWVTEQVAEDPLPPWPKENPHRCDAMDALPYNMQIMSQADHAALHGYSANVSFVDEWDSLPSDKIHDQAMAACAGGGGHD